MVLFLNGTDKNRFSTHVFLFLQRVNDRPLFGTVLLHFSCPSKCGLVLAVSLSLALLIPLSKKQRVNAFYPFLDSLRTVPFYGGAPASTEGAHGRSIHSHRNPSTREKFGGHQRTYARVRPGDEFVFVLDLKSFLRKN